MLKGTLYVHLINGRGVEVRGAVAFTIEEGALYVWEVEIADGLEAGVGGQLVKVFAPAAWTHAEWLGR